VSCVPRATLQLTAEHAILLMLALGKKLLEADDAVRKDRWDRDRVRPDHNVAYNWAGISGIGGLFGKTVGIIGLGEVGSLAAGWRAPLARACSIATATGCLPHKSEARRRIAPIDRLLAESDFVSLHATNIPENRGLIGAETFAR
jgi:phosphoglycerate dehydrogenase-like enzyme